MKAFLFSLCYNILYTVGWLVTLPSYLLKQKRRGGFGTGLLERFGLYRVSYNREPKGVLYVHAVSVGEVVLALKFLRAWLRERGGSAVLATSTATGHATAVSAQIPGVRVIYAPFDLLGLPGRCFDRFEPEAIVLVEAELWPNFARAAKVRGIPMAMINARMSARSESRYRAFKWISKYYFSFLDAMGVQDKGDVRRFESVGVRSSIIHVTGSIEFDQQMAERREANAEFASILDKLKRGKPVVLAASTHDGDAVHVLPVDTVDHAERLLHVRIGLPVAERDRAQVRPQARVAVLDGAFKRVAHVGRVRRARHEQPRRQSGDGRTGRRDRADHMSDCGTASGIVVSPHIVSSDRKDILSPVMVTGLLRFLP